MNIYYFSEVYSKGKDAGNKARNDVDKILSLKYKKLTPYEFRCNNKLIKFLQLIKSTVSVKKEDVIIIQYPLPRGLNWATSLIAKLKRVIFIVHDLYELRQENYSGNEVKKMARAYGIVSHNSKMTDFLVKNGIDKNKISNLEIFDYLVNENNSTSNKQDQSFVCFAGNLAKSNFIYDINENITDLGVNIYGINYDEKKNSKLNYMGSFDSEIIHNKLRGRFGLVWDGDSTESCIGSFGNYMKYNNPHKVSMYIAAGIPIIIWKEAAMANYIETHKIGYSINNINEIKKIESNISERKYSDMLKNVQKIKEQITNGKMLKKALNKLLGE